MGIDVILLRPLKVTLVSTRFKIFVCELLKMGKAIFVMYFEVCFRIPSNSNNVSNTLSGLTNLNVIGEEVLPGGGGGGHGEPK